MDYLLSVSVLTPKDVIVSFFQSHERVLRFASGLIYNSSKKAGQMACRKFLEEGLFTRENCVEMLALGIELTGYAEKAEIVERTSDRIVFRLKGSLLGSRLKSKKPVDTPIAGFIAGWLEACLERRVDVREKECVASGHDYCVFEARIR